jgi:GNAT superfamily N-acetyltransferase
MNVSCDVSGLVVRPVSSWRDRRRFQQLPWSIYAGNPHWVPPLLAPEKQLLGWGKHPFYDHAQCQTLLAERDGQVVGRIAAFINDIHNEKYREKRGFFGFFECVDDTAAARSLFAAARDWLGKRGMTCLRGPVNLSLNYTCGLLIDGFDHPPCLLMTYNPPYYAALLEACGFVKAQDLYAYDMDAPLLATMTAKYKPSVLALLDSSRTVIRPFDKRHYTREIETYLSIYNRALEGTWGFTPLQPREARHIADELKQIIVPEFAVFAEIDGETVGAMLMLLDYNQILRKLNGRLSPLGIWRLLTGRKRITTVRVMAMTMVPGHQASGLSIVLLDKVVGPAAEWGITNYQFSWVLESNAQSRGTLTRTKTKLTSTYRIYDQPM